MTTATDPKGNGRRTFLRGLAGAGAATTALVMTGRAVGDTGPGSRDRTEGPAPAKGYRVTPHIKTYYDKAGF